MERIRGLDVLSRRFTLPAGFDPEKYLAGALGVISGDLFTVKVVFAKKLARYIRERLWYPSQKFRDLTDGRLELTLHVADTLEVRRWILGYDVQAEVIEPAGMREALRQEAEAVAERLARSGSRLLRAHRRSGARSGAPSPSSEFHGPLHQEDGRRTLRAGLASPGSSPGRPPPHRLPAIPRARAPQKDSLSPGW